MEFIIITGMSGAGKSCVVNSLEDLGFFCVDNLPSKLIPAFAKLVISSNEYKRVAVVTDIRAGASFSTNFNSAINELNELEIPYKLFFIDAKDDVLVKRYKETRRIHPLLQGSRDNVINAIIEERKILSFAKELSDYYLETSNLSAIQCRVRVISMFSSCTQETINIQFMSFGFKHGIPNDADFVFDVRFLPNPFYIPQLKAQTGLDSAVSDYVMSFDESKQLFQSYCNLLELAFPLCIKEGRTQLVVAIGCTGGHHRSVTFAQSLCQHFSSKNYNCFSSHRDIQK